MRGNPVLLATLIIFLALLLLFGRADALLSSSPLGGGCRRTVNRVKWHATNSCVVGMSGNSGDQLFTDTPINSALAQSVGNGNNGEANNISRGEAMVDYSNLVGSLKTTPRVGWAIRGVPDHESVADHSWRVAALCFLLPREKFNIAKCIEMAVVHDMAECIVGDITPEDNIPKATKQKMEMDAMLLIVKTLKQGCINGDQRDESPQYLLDIFHEYEERTSKEAAAVKDLDQLDMILQADEYEKNHNIDMSDFFDGTPIEKFVTPEIQEAAEEVHRRRRQRVEAIGQADAVMTSFEPAVDDSIGIWGNDESTMSDKDKEFVATFASGSDLSPDEIQKVVRALRGWEKDSS